MRKESAWRKGASRLLVLLLTAAVILTFSFTNVSFAEEGGSTGQSRKYHFKFISGRYRYPA